MFESTGYSKLARGIIKYLTFNGVKVQLIPFEKKRDKTSKDFDYKKLTYNNVSDKVVLQHCDPSMSVSGIGKRNVLLTIFELNGIPNEWVNIINRRFQELWLPNKFVVDGFKNSGVKLNPYIMPHALETDNMCPGESNFQLKNKDGFVFLTNFQWGPRKGYDILLEAYLREFSSDDNVYLIIKYHGQMAQDVVDTITNEIKNRTHKRNPPKFLLWRNFIMDEDLVHLYRLADCFVLPSRAEGWGLPYMEAMSCGLPTIGTNWSGNLTYMNTNNSYLIKVEKFEHPNFGEWYKPPLYYSLPSISHLRHLMRYVYEHPKEARLRGSRARRDIVKKYDWKVVIKTFLKRIEEICK